MKQAFRVGISGSYGGLNLGDEAILQVIISQLRRSLPVDITVFSRDPDDTLARHRVKRAVPVRDLLRHEVTPEVEQLDLFILGGGGILFDAEAATYLREVKLALDLRVPVMLYAIGAGPLQDPAMGKLVRDTLNRVDAITVREREAQRVLDEIGVRKEVQVTADPALLLEPEPLPSDALSREGIDGQRRLVGVSLREPGPAAPEIDERHYHELLANAADYMIDRLDANLVFVPMEPSTADRQHSHAVISRMANAHRASVLRGNYTSGQILSIISHFEFAVGMRLHFLMFAAMQHVPFVALPYAGKVTGFLQALELRNMPLQQLNVGRLIAHIDRSWDTRRDLQARIDRTIPILQQRARETNDVAVRLLMSGARGAQIYHRRESA